MNERRGENRAKLVPARRSFALHDISAATHIDQREPAHRSEVLRSRPLSRQDVCCNSDSLPRERARAPIPTGFTAMGGYGTLDMVNDGFNDILLYRPFKIHHLAGAGGSGGASVSGAGVA